MDALYEELDEVKTEIEKLREQYRVKTELAESLRKAHNDQLSKAKEVSSKLDKLEQQLTEKDDELFTVKQMNEELKSNLKEKESIIKHLNSINDKLRANKEAGSELEKLSRELNEKEDELFAVKKMNKELKSDLMEKESALKHLSSVTDRLRASKEVSSKFENVLSEKEDQLYNAQQLNDELTSMLKEKDSIIKKITYAHEKLRVECNERLHKFDEENKALAFALEDANEKNTDQEQQIRALKEEIEGVRKLLAVSQKKKLSETESLTKISKEVEHREDVFLKLEEDNRKFEDQLKWKKEQFGHLEESHKKLCSEFKAKEKEWDKEKSMLIDELSSLQSKLESQIRISQDTQRRLEMCEQALAHAESKKKLLEAQLLDSKISFDKVCGEYDQAKLDFEALTYQRDQELANLRTSLGTKEILYKEMEYQFRRLEQEKHELLSSLKEIQEDQIREVRFSSSASKLQSKLKSLEQVHRGCSANLKAKEVEWKSQMEKLTEELNSCKSELKNQDISINKLETELEACDDLMLKLELLNQETSLMLFVLRSEFSEAQLRLVADANSYIDSKNQQVEDNVCGLIEQLEKKKVALNDMRQDLEEEREKVVMLSEKVQTLEELQLPLQKELDRLKDMLKESSDSSLVQSDEQVMQLQSDLEKVNEALDRANEELYEKFCEANEIEYELQLWKSVAEQFEAVMKQNYQMRMEVEASLLAQIEVEANLKQEKESLSSLLEEKERRIEDLEQQLVEVAQVQETVKNKAEQSVVVRQLKSYESDEEQEEDKDNDIHQLVEEKDQRIGNLQQLVTSLENEFESSTSCFSSRLTQMQKETSRLRESWERIKEMVIMKEIKIQEKNMIIKELENELEDLQERVDQQDKALFGYESTLQQTQEQLEKRELEAHRLKRELEGKNHSSRKLSLENKKLLSTMTLLSEKINHLTVEDMNLMESLGNIVQNLDVERNQDDDEQENMKVFLGPHVKSVQTTTAIYEERSRSPFRAINT